MKVNNDLINASLNQGWKVLSGPILLFMIPIFLTEIEQGFWYTFISLSALAIFANLGFSTILLQFSAHEFAHLNVDKSGSLAGSPMHLARLSSLWNYAFDWSIKIGFFAFIAILIFGFLFLSAKESDLSWEWAWIVYGIASLLVFWNSMALSFFEGCDDVRGTHGIRFKMGVVLVLSSIVFLYYDFGLYSLSFSLVLSSVFGFILLFVSKKKLISQFSQFSHNKGNWKKEILPLLKRYSVSWVSGYFIFQAFTPIAFYYYGPVAAGKVGLTMAIFYAIFSISNVWITIIVPKINMYISTRNYNELNPIFLKSTLRCLIFFLLSVICFIFFVQEVALFEFIKNRVVSFFSIILIAIAWFIQVAINSMAIYVRAHKVEPFVFLSVINSVYIVSVTLFSAIFLSFDWFFIGFFSSYIIFSIFFYKIFRGFFLGFP